MEIVNRGYAGMQFYIMLKQFIEFIFNALLHQCLHVGLVYLVN